MTISDISASWSAFMTRSLTLGVLFSAPAPAVVVAKLVILGISVLISSILALILVALVAKLVMQGILS